MNRSVKKFNKKNREREVKPNACSTMLDPDGSDDGSLFYLSDFGSDESPDYTYSEEDNEDDEDEMLSDGEIEMDKEEELGSNDKERRVTKKRSFRSRYGEEEEGTLKTYNLRSNNKRNNNNNLAEIEGVQNINNLLKDTNPMNAIMTGMLLGMIVNNNNNNNKPYFNNSMMDPYIQENNANPKMIVDFDCIFDKRNDDEEFVDDGLDLFDKPLKITAGQKKKFDSLIKKKLTHDELKMELKKRGDLINFYKYRVEKSAKGNEKKPLNEEEKVLIMPIPDNVKIQILQHMFEPEREKWIKVILDLPFSYLPLPVAIGKNSNEEIQAYLIESRKKMDCVVKGHDEPKEEIMDFLCRLISNPKAKGNVLGLCGPKGVGKTRLIKKGIADALGRPFHVINLGGLKDPNYLTGHSFTYVGSKMGRIGEIIRESQTLSPVIYLDELDKISDQSNDIWGILTSLLDEEQNSEFVDDFLSIVKLDLSKVLWVASFNDISLIDPIVLDRIKVIKVPALTHDQKFQIITDYLIPEILDLFGFKKNSFKISDEAMKTLICRNQEDGCRKLKKSLTTIIQKINTSSMNGEIERTMDENNPFVIEVFHVDKYLKKEENQLPHPHLYI